MFLVGQNAFGSGFAGLACLEHGYSGMAKTLEHSFAYRKCREKDTKPSPVNDTEDTLKKE